MFERYSRINEAVGISVFVGSEGTYRIDACSIEVKNNALTFTKKITGLKSMGDVLKHFSPNLPVAMVLHGKGVLNKTMDILQEINPANFNNILLNANPEDFYVQNFKSGTRSFVSIIRKTEADNWVSQLQEGGFKLLSLTLGPYGVQNILPQLNFYDTEIKFCGNIIILNEQKEWLSYQYQEGLVADGPIRAESEQLDESLVLPYAAVYQLAINGATEWIAANIPGVESAKDKYLSFQKLKRNALIFLFVFFGLLLGNFILFSALNAANAKLTGRLSLFTQNFEDSKRMENVVMQKKQILQDLGWDGNLSKSYLIDQLASLLPSDVTLTEITINPVMESPGKVQSTVDFYTNTIFIEGVSEKIIPVDEWIARIKTKTWVKGIQLKSYFINTELNSGRFTISINY